MTGLVPGVAADRDAPGPDGTARIVVNAERPYPVWVGHGVAARLPETVTGFRGVRYPKEDAALERFARLMEEAR